MTDHTTASSEPLVEWRAKGWPDLQQHPIALSLRRGETRDHADAPGRHME